MKSKISPKNPCHGQLLLNVKSIIKFQVRLLNFKMNFGPLNLRQINNNINLSRSPLTFIDIASIYKILHWYRVNIICIDQKTGCSTVLFSFSNGIDYYCFCCIMHLVNVKFYLDQSKCVGMNGQDTEEILLESFF